MGGRSRLRGGFSPWLRDHRSREGHTYRRFLRAGVELLGREPNGRAAERVAVEQYARALLVHELATLAWADLMHRRQTGKGRRPNDKRIERQARRVGLQEQSVKDAETRLRVLAARGQPLPYADVVAAYQSRPGPS